MRRYFRFILSLVLVCVLLVLLFQTKSTLADFSWRAVRPISIAMNRAGVKVSRLFSAFGEIVSLREQNRLLTEKIARMEVDGSRIAELEHENNLLQKEIGFAGENKSYELVPAKIIGREPTTFLDYIIIDQGKDMELSPGMAVISDGTLVGQLKEVYENSAKVVLITSKNSAIQAMLQVNRSKGILRGGISGLALENISQDAEIVSGEYVVTSGLGGKMEQGILIGKTGGNRSSSSDIFQSVSVEPVADLSKLELVFVARSLNKS